MDSLFGNIVFRIFSKPWQCWQKQSNLIKSSPIGRKPAQFGNTGSNQFVGELLIRNEYRMIWTNTPHSSSSYSFKHLIKPSSPNLIVLGQKRCKGKMLWGFSPAWWVIWVLLAIMFTFFIWDSLHWPLLSNHKHLYHWQTWNANTLFFPPSQLDE